MHIRSILSSTRRFARPVAALALLTFASKLSAQTAQDASSRLNDPAEGEVVSMDAFKVEGIREGMARAITEQRAADNVKNVLAADSVGRFPDLNLADSLGRVSGISIERDQGEARFINVRGAPSDYTSVAIDGVTMPSPTTGSRAMRLDTIPSDIVGTLEVTKAITPDIDADNIGGFVNIRTQGAFDRPGRAFRTNLGYGFNDLGGGEVYNVGFTYSDRLLADKNLGVLVGYTNYMTDRHTANIENNPWQRVPGSTDTNLFRPTRPDTRTYELVRSRSSYNGRIDFKPTANTYLYFSTVFSDWSDDEKRDNYRLPFSTSNFEPGSSFPTGVVRNVLVDSNHNIRDVVNTIKAYTIGGEHRFGDTKLDFVISAGSATVETKKPNTYYNFRLAPTAVRPTVAYDFSGDPDLPSITRINDSQTLMSPPQDMQFLQYNQRGGTTEDDDLTLGLNVTFPIELGGRDSTLKFGAKFKSKEKVRNEETFRWTAAAVPFAVSFSDLIGSELATNFGRYPWGYKHSRGRAAALGQRIRESGPGVDQRNTRFGNYYEVSEEILAGYGMMTTELANRLRIVGGVRVEHTKNTGTANRTNDNWATFTSQTASNDYTEFFPSLHFVYPLAENQTLKVSFSTAVARANFSTLRPSEVINETEFTISAGNPDIKATTSRGVDVYYDMYLRPVGLFTAGVFAKQIDDPIFSGTTLETRNGVQYEVNKALNGSDGQLYGFELNFERTLSFLPYPFDGFGLFTNFTYTKSEAEVPPNADGTSGGKQSLQGSSEQTYNVAVFFEKGGFNARLSYLYRSEWLDSTNRSTPELTRFWDERPQLDFTASFPINRWTSLYVQANNLTEERGRRFLGNRTRIYELEGFGSSYLFGAKINF